MITSWQSQLVISKGRQVGPQLLCPSTQQHVPACNDVLIGIGRNCARSPTVKCRTCVSSLPSLLETLPDDGLTMYLIYFICLGISAGAGQTCNSCRAAGRWQVRQPSPRNQWQALHRAGDARSFAVVRQKSKPAFSSQCAVQSGGAAQLAGPSAA